MNPNAVRRMQEQVAFARIERIQMLLDIEAQQRRINARLDRIGIVSPERRASARAKGYRGPLTRHELARRIAE